MYETTRLLCGVRAPFGMVFQDRRFDVDGPIPPDALGSVNIRRGLRLAQDAGPFEYGAPVSVSGCRYSFGDDERGADILRHLVEHALKLRREWRIAGRTENVDRGKGGSGRHLPRLITLCNYGGGVYARRDEDRTEYFL